MTAMHTNVIVEHAPQRIVRTEVRDHREPRPVVIVRDHDRPRPVIIAPAPVVVTRTVYEPAWTPSPAYTYVPQPIALLAATPVSDGSLAIDTAGQLGGATTLQLEAAGNGSTYVKQVVLYDADGGYQVVKVDALLSAQNPSVDVALGGANVVKVAVDGHSDWGGAIAIQAR